MGTKIIYTCDVCNRTVDIVRKFVYGVQDAPAVVDACESCAKGVLRAIVDGIKAFSSTPKDDVKPKAGKGK